MSVRRILRRSLVLWFTLLCVGLLCASAGTEPPEAQNADPPVYVLHTVQSAAAPTMQFLTGGMAFSPEEAEEISVVGTSPYLSEVRKDALLTAPYTVHRSGGEPSVLIIHTHTTEAYAPTEGYRSEDEAENIVRVGEALAESLRENGIGVIHNQTIHDQPTFGAAYQACLEDLTPILAQNPSICVVLDVHRDAYAVDGEQQAYLTELDGKASAQILLVCGDGGNYDYDGWRENLNWAVKLCAAANRFAPGLVRTLRLDHARYNQHTMPGAILVEVGAAGNALDEALIAARYFGKVLAKVLQTLPE